jgi:hypothetical protein
VGHRTRYHFKEDGPERAELYWCGDCAELCAGRIAPHFKLNEANYTKKFWNKIVSEGIELNLGIFPSWQVSLPLLSHTKTTS